MAMVSVKLLADDMGLGVNDVRRIARNLGIERYKDNKVEMYDTDDFESFGVFRKHSGRIYLPKT